MRLCWYKFWICCAVFFLGLTVPIWAAELTINILAVNGTDKTKEKEINFPLPAELSIDDVLDSAGLKLDYNVNEGSYFVKGHVELTPKETKTFKIRINDIWQIDNQKIEEIKTQIDLSLARIKDTEYYDTGVVRKDSLLQRIDYIIEEQERYADDVEKRIDRFRVYAGELDEIRKNSLSVKYWRSRPPSVEDGNVITLVLEVENSSETKTQTVKKKHYLPTEVKPEHLVGVEGFEVKYDAIEGKSYLIREEELKPKEVKKYKIGIIDIWNIPQVDIENLKDRTRKVYKLLEKTKYVDSAGYLVGNIKKNLEKIESSQSQEKEIKEHISSFRLNTKRFNLAKNDVEALEDLLDAVKEDLERSKLKNVLKRVRSLRDIIDIAKSIFKKPELNTAWKIILGIMVFVGLFTAIHFTIWGRRSKDVVIEDENSEEENQGNEQEDKKE